MTQFETRDSTRNRLTACAAALWLKSGPGAISFGQISAEAGVPKSVAAYHFPSASGLLEVAAARICREFQTRADVVAQELCEYDAAQDGASGPRLWKQLVVQALGPDGYGAALLEIAFLALDDSAYRRRLVGLIAALRRSVRRFGPHRQPVEPRTAFALALGAVMTHAARAHGAHHVFVLDRELDLAFTWPSLPTACGSAPDGSVAPNVRGAVEGPRERILDAAIDLLAVDGLRTMSHRALARHADLSLSATTYYFGSKTEIFEATLERLIERARFALTAAEPTNRPAHIDFIALIDALSAFYLGVGRAETRAHFNIGLVAARTPSMRRSMEDFYGLQIDNFRALAPAFVERDGRDLIPVLYKLVSGHLLLAMLKL